MTTPEAAMRYLAEHQRGISNEFYVFNPHGKDEAELPTIFGFNNGGSPGLFYAAIVAEDGAILGGHLCSHEGYMPSDLGLLVNSRPDRQETFRQHYPDGFKTEFVSYNDVPSHPKLGPLLKNATQKDSKSDAVSDKDSQNNGL